MFFSFAKITEAQCFLFFWYFSFSIFISFRNTLCRIWTFFCNFGSMLFSFSLFFFLYFLLTWFWLHGNSMLSFFIFAGHEQSILDMFVTRFLFILPFLLLSAGTHFFPYSVLFLIKKTRTFLEEHTFMCQKVSSFKLKQLKATRAKRISYKYNGNGNCAQEIHTKGKIIHRFFEKYGKMEETSRSLDKRKKFQWMKERERENEWKQYEHRIRLNTFQLKIHLKLCARLICTISIPFLSIHSLIHLVHSPFFQVNNNKHNFYHLSNFWTVLAGSTLKVNANSIHKWIMFKRWKRRGKNSIWECALCCCFLCMWMCVKPLYLMHWWSKTRTICSR